MPSFVYTTAVLTLTGQTISILPARLEYETAVLNLTGQNMIVASNWTGGNITRLNLPRVRREFMFPVNRGGPARMSLTSQRAQNEDKRRIEEAFDGLLAQVSQMQRAFDEAAVARAEAAEASARADAVETETNLQQSYIKESGTLTATSDGTVSIAAHTRVYKKDENEVSVDAGSVTGQVGTVYISYSDPTRMGGTVVYESSGEQPVQSGNTHVVGAVTVPAAGDPPAGGSGPNPPGYIQVDIV